MNCAGHGQSAALPFSGGECKWWGSCDGRGAAMTPARRQGRLLRDPLCSLLGAAQRKIIYKNVDMENLAIIATFIILKVIQTLKDIFIF